MPPLLHTGSGTPHQIQPWRGKAGGVKVSSTGVSIRHGSAGECNDAGDVGGGRGHGVSDRGARPLAGQLAGCLPTLPPHHGGHSGVRHTTSIDLLKYMHTHICIYIICIRIYIYNVYHSPYNLIATISLMAYSLRIVDDGSCLRPFPLPLALPSVPSPCLTPICPILVSLV